MPSAEEYRSAVEEFDRLWATDRAGQAETRMDALLLVIEDYERALIWRRRR
jgi:hypothetical protein